MRPVLFWLHLVAGVLAGSVILIMSITGLLLTYEKQTIQWVDRAVNTVAAQSPASRLPIDELLAVAPAATALTLRRDPTAAAQLTLGRHQVLYLNPYTGQKIGEGSVPLRAFFQSATAWHRWLGENTPLTKGITGAANALFVLLILTGLPMWLQRPIYWFRRGLSPKARDYNWHHVLGAIFALPLLAIAFTALFFSYPGLLPPSPAAPKVPPMPLRSVYEPLWRQIDAPRWQTMTLRPAAIPTATFAIEEGDWGRVDLKSQWVFDRVKGTLLRTERYENLPPVRRFRSWVRTVHTGEAGGLLGQTLAGLACAAACVLVWTGLALSWRRWRTYRLNATRPVDASRSPASPPKPTSL